MKQALENELREVQFNLMSARDAVKVLTEKEQNIKIQLYKNETGLYVGCNVLFKGKNAVVSSFEVGYNYVFPILKMMKKDGSIGALEKKIYSWEFDKLQIIS